MIKYSLIFPGQGSQSIGMMDGLAHIPIIKKTFIEASEILGKDFWAMVTSDNDDINQTVNTQPLMLMRLGYTFASGSGMIRTHLVSWQDIVWVKLQH